MFEDKIAGQPIRVSDINDLQDALSGLLNVSQGSGTEGFRDHRINATRHVDLRGITMVRITADVYPESSLEFIAAYGPFNSQLPNDLFGSATTPIPANAIVQVYNPEANANGGPTGWQDDPQGETLYVTSYAKEPLAVNDRVPVYFDRSNNRWLPASQTVTDFYYLANPGQTVTVSIPGGGSLAVQLAHFLVYDSDLCVFHQGPAAYVADGNMVPIS